MNLSLCNEVDEPCFHVFIGESDKIIAELKRYLNDEKITIRVINGFECNSLHKLFYEFSTKLEFPYYFSGVYGSFDECINDLDWINASGYIILITNSEQILIDESCELDTVFKILKDCAYEWTHGRNYDDFPTPPTPFHIILNYNDDSIHNIDKVFAKLKISWSYI